MELTQLSCVWKGEGFGPKEVVPFKTFNGTESDWRPEKDLVAGV